MADIKMKSRIMLRNDDQENWNSSSLNLEKGEVAISFQDNGNAVMRVGNGNTYENAAKLEIENGDTEIKDILYMILDKLNGISDQLKQIHDKQSDIRTIIYG